MERFRNEGKISDPYTWLAGFGGRMPSVAPHPNWDAIAIRLGHAINIEMFNADPNLFAALVEHLALWNVEIPPLSGEADFAAKLDAAFAGMDAD